MKKIPHTITVRQLGAALALASLALTATAQNQVFFENFDADHSLDNTWVTNSAGGYNPANLFFDYSTVGIPSAPNSTNGDHARPETTGESRYQYDGVSLRLECFAQRFQHYGEF